MDTEAMRAYVGADVGENVRNSTKTMARELIPRDEWNQLPVDGRLQRLLGMSLDDCKSLLEVDPLDCHPAMLNAKIQVIRAVLHTSVKLGLEGRRLAEERERVIGELATEFRKGVPRSE